MAKNQLKQEPLCGWEWYNKHKNDITRELIASLGIQISIDGRKLPTLKKHQLLKELMNIS